MVRCSSLGVPSHAWPGDTKFFYLVFHTKILIATVTANHEFGPFMACMSGAQRVGGRHRNRIQATKANIFGVSKRSESKRTKSEEKVGEVRWDIGMRRADGSLLEDFVSPASNVPSLHATPLETARHSYSLLDLPLGSAEGPHDVLRLQWCSSVENMMWILMKIIMTYYALVHLPVKQLTTCDAPST